MAGLRLVPPPAPEPATGCIAELLPGEYEPNRGVKKRVRWFPPHPSNVHALAAKTLEDTGNEILAQALRNLARCDAQDDARPNQYIVPDRAAVIDWLEQMRGDIDWTIHFLQTEPDAPAQLTAELPEPFKQTCAVCERTFIPRRSTARYCSAACRQRAYRERN